MAGSRLQDEGRGRVYNTIHGAGRWKVVFAMAEPTAAPSVDPKKEAREIAWSSCTKRQHPPGPQTPAPPGPQMPASPWPPTFSCLNLESERVDVKMCLVRHHRLCGMVCVGCRTMSPVCHKPIHFPVTVPKQKGSVSQTTSWRAGATSRSI